MFQHTSPLDDSSTPFLHEFFQLERTQCLCFKMPSHPDGWVIQGLGKITFPPEHIQTSIVQDLTTPKFTSTPENFSSGIAVSVVCLGVYLLGLIRSL